MTGTQPEQLARREIDRLLDAAGWAVQDTGAADLAAARGVALNEFPLLPGHGFTDDLLYVDGKACGVIEASGPGKPLKAEPPDAGEFAGHKRSGLARLKDAATPILLLEGGFDPAYNVLRADGMCFGDHVEQFTHLLLSWRSAPA